MASLRDQLTGVQVESPPTEEPEDLDVAPAEEDDAGADKKDSDGRSIDNVRGELLRKQEKEFSAMRDLISDLRSEIATLKSQPAPQQPAAKNSLDDYTVAELEAYASQVPEEKQQEFAAYLQSRKMEERLTQKVEKLTSQQQLQNQRQQFNQKAVELYPDLANDSSPIARRVEAALREVSEDVIQTNPRIVYDLANTAAVELNVTPKAVKRPTQPAPSNSGPAPAPKSKSKRSDEERAKIAKNLANALPRGKKFDMDRIREKEEFYATNLDDYVRRG